MQTFQAGVQYGDFEGSVAADRIDKGDMTDFLEAAGLMGPDDFLIGAEVFVGENHPGRMGSTFVRVFLIEARNYEEAKSLLAAEPLEVRRVEVPVDLETFVRFFKRFNVIITRRGLNLIGREFQVREA
ncbi:MAG TPA: hypothetical protein VGR19_02125 [Allosphingosinicella sp.]|nr:hypothetical protein [Allosphingosinicella sp.]